MHWKTRRTLQNATKLYVTLAEAGSDYCTELRIQLANGKFAYIDLSETWPDPIRYRRLGFDLPEDNLVHIYNKARTLQILENSIQFGENDPATVSTAIELINGMKKKGQ